MATDSNRITHELDLLGFKATTKCYCGCGEPTNSYFAPGHDSRFAANLLSQLRHNNEVRLAIHTLIYRSHFDPA